MRAKTKRARRRQWAQAYVAAQRGLGEYPYRFGVSPLQWSSIEATAQARKRARGAHDIYTQVAREKAELPRNAHKNRTTMLCDSWRVRDAWRRYAAEYASAFDGVLQDELQVELEIAQTFSHHLAQAER